MDMLGNPTEMMISMVLGILSFALTSAGIKSGKLSWALWGVGLGLPSYFPGDPMWWIMGGVICFIGYKVAQYQ